MFLAAFGAITLAGWLLSKLIKATPLDLADKLGGMVIGLLKGAVVISILLLLLTFLPLPREANQKLDRSGMIRSMRKVAPWVYEKTKGLWPKAQELYKEFEKTPEPKKVEELISPMGKDVLKRQLKDLFNEKILKNGDVLDIFFLDFVIQ